ncbi:MAG: mismatch-specific DNA-glycosylase [Schumannella sp.]|nr:mismatch-specific DNA-glycosylase [Schumannella sp.]
MVRETPRTIPSASILTMPGLPDILAPDLDVVICGSSVAPDSAALGHYYANRNNSFWRLLHETGLTPNRLAPVDDGSLLQYGIGLTDLAKNRVESDDRRLNARDFDVPGLIEKLEEYRPRWLALHGIGLTGALVAKALGHRPPKKGAQTWRAGPSNVFVLPQSSGRSTVPPGPTWAEMARTVRGGLAVPLPQAQPSAVIVPSQTDFSSSRRGLTTPEQLAAELGRKPSTIRAWIRLQAWRAEAEKGAAWYLSAQRADAVRRHFSAG